jgi:hypothetical protein
MHAKGHPSAAAKILSAPGITQSTGSPALCEFGVLCSLGCLLRLTKQCSWVQ